MFSGRDYFAIFIQRNSIIVSSSLIKKNISIEVPSDIVRYGEIVDFEGYQNFIESFLKDKVKKNVKCFVAVSPEIVYEDSLDVSKLTGSKKKDQIIKFEQTFLNNTPISIDQNVYLKITDKGVIRFFSTSELFLLPMVNWCESLRIPLISIFPLSILGKVSLESSNEILKSLLKQKGKIKNYNFLKVLKKKHKFKKGFLKDDSAKGFSIKRILMFLFSLLIFVFSVIYTWQFFSSL